MTARDRIAAGVALAHRWGLDRARAAMSAHLKGRDRTLPALLEVRNLTLEGAAGPLDARLYVPKAAEADGPLLVYFHGGGFVICDIETHDALCTRLADVAGLRVLACNYRLAPEHPFPAQLEDAEVAVRWAQDHATDLGVNPAKIAVGGDSAGGYLSAAVAARLNATAPGSIKAQILLYPLLDLDDDVWASSVMQDTRIVGRIAVRYIEAQLAIHAPSLLAPGALPPLPSVIVAGGALDPCRPEALIFAEQLKAAGAPVEWRTYPGLVHGFGNLTHVSARARTAVAEIGALAGKVIRAATA